jgi:hypothetical protein
VRRERTNDTNDELDEDPSPTDDPTKGTVPQRELHILKRENDVRVDLNVFTRAEHVRLSRPGEATPVQEALQPVDRLRAGGHGQATFARRGDRTREQREIKFKKR